MEQATLKILAATQTNAALNDIKLINPFQFQLLETELTELSLSKQKVIITKWKRQKLNQ